jgi:hypothetical protein
MNGGYPVITSKPVTPRQVPAEELTPHIRAPVLGMIRDGVDSSVVVQSFESRIKDQRDVKYQTAARRILVDIHTSYAAVFGALEPAAGATDSPPCILDILRIRKYTAEDVVILGFTFSMLATDSRNMKHLLDRTFFSARQLARQPLNITFADLMLAGLPASTFAAAGYSNEELAILHFSVPAFVAAGGTKVELDTMRISDRYLTSVFSFTKDADRLWC